MSDQISKESFEETVKDMPNACLVMLYCISRHHEKYIFTQWCMKALIERGFGAEDLRNFDKDFSKFYELLLTQEDL